MEKIINKLQQYDILSKYCNEELPLTLSKFEHWVTKIYMMVLADNDVKKDLNELHNELIVVMDKIDELVKNTL